MNDNEQPLDLDAIRARADAATPGPWAIVERNGDPIRRKLRGANDQFILGLAALLYPDPADADFLIHAREDVPALLALVDRLHGLAAVIEQARAALAAYRRTEYSYEGIREDDIIDLDEIEPILSAAPSDVLAEVKREAAAQALNAFVSSLDNEEQSIEVALGGAGYVSVKATELAAAIREGRS